MTPEERSRRLQREADEVLAMVHLKRHCSAVGKIIPTGSYYLDCMMYPDIDLYIPPISIDSLLRIGIKLAKYKCVNEIVFQKGSEGDLSRGLYLKPIIIYGNWGRPWKIDIWSLPTRIIEKKQSELEKLKERMTPQHKHIILHYKFSILSDKCRTPMFSGFHIYQAVINLGLKDFSKITEYLRENGIKI